MISAFIPPPPLYLLDGMTGNKSLKSEPKGLFRAFIVRVLWEL